MESDIRRVVGAGGARSGKVVGRYFIESDTGRIELHIERFEREFRHMVEFVMRTSPYSKADISKLDYLTFFRIVNECEQREKEAIDRLEKQTHGGS